MATLNAPDFATLSEHDRRMYVRQMLTDESVRSKCILMAGKDGNGQAIDLNGLMATVGPQKVEDMLVELLGKSHTESAVMSDEDVISLMEKVKSGKASPVEQQMAHFILSTIDKEKVNAAHMQSEATSLMAHTILDILQFFKKETGYEMEYLDVMTAVVTLMIASTSINDQNAMHRFKDAGPDRILPMLQSVADDIADKLDKAFGGKKPPSDILLLGLLTYAEKLSANFDNKQHKWGDPKELAAFFGLDHSFGDEGSNNDDGSNEPNGENGSNQANTCEPDCIEPNNGGESKND